MVWVVGVVDGKGRAKISQRGVTFVSRGECLIEKPESIESQSRESKNNIGAARGGNRT